MKKKDQMQRPPENSLFCLFFQYNGLSVWKMKTCSDSPELTMGMMCFAFQSSISNVFSQVRQWMRKMVWYCRMYVLQILTT